MSKVSHEIGREVADQLFAAERAIDAAVREAAKLTAMLPDASERARLSIGMTQDVLAHVVDSSVLLVRARASVAAAHKGLEVVQRFVGLGGVAFGPFVDKPEQPPQPSGLTIVERAA